MNGSQSVIGFHNGVNYFVYEKTGENPHYFIYDAYVGNYVLVKGIFTPGAYIGNYAAATTAAGQVGNYFALPFATKQAVADYAREYGGNWLTGKRPDISGLFYDDTLGYNVGDRGGFNEVKLEVAQMPSHNHTHEGFLLKNGAATPNNSIPWYNWGPPNNQYAANTPIGQTGGNLPHENRPPYYALAFIIYTGA
jgi:microcystin-dependent protein